MEALKIVGSRGYGKDVQFVRRNGSDFLTSRFAAPYSREVGQKTQEDVRKRVSRWVVDKGIASADEVYSTLERHAEIITPDRLNMARDNLHHYWGLVVAYGLGKTHEVGFDRERSNFARGLENIGTYVFNQLAWTCVGLDLERKKRGGRLGIKERENIEFAVSQENSPFYRAFHTTWLGATGEQVVYPWAKEVLQREREVAKIEKELEEKEDKQRRIVLPEEHQMIVPAQQVLFVVASDSKSTA